MKTTHGVDRAPYDRMTYGEAAHAGVSLLIGERKRDAERARMSDRTAATTRSLRTRAGLAIVTLGRLVGGSALDRTAHDTLPSPAARRPARAGRAG